MNDVALCSILALLVALSLGGGARAQEAPSLILGRPSDSAVTINALAGPGEVVFEYGESSGAGVLRTAPVSTTAGPAEVSLQGLRADTRYAYRALFRAESESEFLPGAEHTFHTQRAAGSPFTFTLQADSHQGTPFFHNADLYRTMFANVAGDRPDFHIDLGDAFSLDGNNETQATVRQKYLNQREAFAWIGHSAPIFLVLGNHENEEGWNLDDLPDVADTLPVLGANARKRYFANPVPDGFYTGNSDASLLAIDGDHLKENYYAFEWGDALFVAIDPFWNTMTKPFAGSTGGEQNDEVVGDRWDWTLGEAQYEWLRSTLENSTAPFKFVFAHHLVGGTQDYSRGGVVGAAYCEWGGYDIDGVTWAFDRRRPNLVMPIHDLLAANGVSIFFHGHDHVFVTEELDGVIYQECPHAANRDYGTGFLTNVFDYAGAELVNNSGHLRVRVSPAEVRVEYVRAFLPGDGPNGEVAVAYSLSAPAANDKPVAADDVVMIEAGEPVAIDVLGNDTDRDGDALAVAGVSQPGGGIAVNQGTDIYYEPLAGYCDSGIPDTFRYAVKDGRGGSRTATVQVTVVCAQDSVVAAADVVAALVDEPLLIDVTENDSDVGGALDPNSARFIRAPEHGTVAGNGDGSFVYVPAAGYVGSDRFDYEVCDLDGNCDSATVVITVAGCYGAGDCDDGSACTVDTCDSASGCVHTPRVCDDTPCIHQMCDPTTGACVADPVVCDDGDPCTDDRCDTDAGCVVANNTAACDDGDPCTTGDRCRAGACGGAPLDCKALDDGCQAGRCDGLDPAGCEAVPVADGTLCGRGGACDAGRCVVPADAGLPDAGADAAARAAADAGLPAAGPPPGPEGRMPDGGAPARDPGSGCSCSLTRRSSGVPALALCVGVLGVALRFRRSSIRSRRSR